MAIDKIDYLKTVLRNSPGEIPEILASALTTFKYRFLRPCTGKNTIIRHKTQIINYANVRIGAGCIFQDSVYIRAGVHGKVVFGDRSMVNSFAKFFGHGGIEIGEDTQIGPGTLITTTDHNYYGKLESIYKRVVIGQSVWIGANVTILPGVDIGDFVVVGAGSVVTKNIPSRSVAVGVPARVIRQFEKESVTERST